MNFEEALQKVKAGTATPEERAFVEERIAEANSALIGEVKLDFDEALAHVKAGTATAAEREYVKSQLEEASAFVSSEGKKAPDAEEPIADAMSLVKTDDASSAIDFEAALEHVQKGTATEQEKLYVKSQMAAANAFFSDDFRRSGAPVKEASGADVKKAKKSFKMRYIIIPLSVVLIAILAVGVILGGVFGYAASSAKSNMTLNREQSVLAAKTYVFANQNKLFGGMDPDTFSLEQLYIEDVEREFNYNGHNLGASYYSYEVEVKGATNRLMPNFVEIEVKLRVNTITQNIEVLDIDIDRD